MQVTVSYMSQLKNVAGVPRETFTIDGEINIKDLVLNKICTRHGNFARAVLEPDGSLRPILVVFVGDMQVDMQAPCRLSDGDEITLMFPIAGG